jgi:hypothetical protein
MVPYEKIKKIIFEKECLKSKEDVSEHEFESLFTNQEILDLEYLLGKDLIHEHENMMNEHFFHSKMSKTSSETLKHAINMYKTVSMKPNKAEIKFHGV